MKFIDLGVQWNSIKNNILDDIIKLIDASIFIGGEYTRETEQELAKYIGTTEAILCSSGTAALEVSLRACGVGHGDEVILPVNTYIATYFAVKNVGATPVLVDIEPRYYTISVEAIKNAITPRTKAVIVVHLYGKIAVDINNIIRLCKHNGLWLIEDNAQAFGASHSDKKAGAFGDISATSFYPAKNLGTWGEGGCKFTNSKRLGEKVRAIINQGQIEKNIHCFDGGNYRISSILVPPIRHGLKQIDAWNNKRIEIARRYSFSCLNEYISVPEVRDKSHVFHQYIVKPRDYSLKQYLINVLSQGGVPTNEYYPDLIYEQPCYSGPRPATPVADEVNRLLLALPIHQDTVSDENIKYITATLYNLCNNIRTVENIRGRSD